MTRRRPLKHDTMDYIRDPLPIELHDKRLELYIDKFKFGGVHFLLMESSQIRYIDIESVGSQAMTNLVPIVQKTIRKYKLRALILHRYTLIINLIMKSLNKVYNQRVQYRIQQMNMCRLRKGEIELSRNGCDLSLPDYLTRAYLRL